MQPGQDLRSKCGQVRVHYDPAWSESRPFQVFVRGEAVNSYARLAAAIERLTNDGFRFEKEQVWK